MKGSLSNILFLISGISTVLGGAYYCIKERKEVNSFKVYGTITMVGIIVTVISIINL